MKKVILIIQICVSLGIQAQNHFTEYTKEDGLISNCIDFIAQDINGAMWFVAGEPWAPTKWTDPNYFGREIVNYVDQEYGLVGESMQMAQKLATVYGVSRFDGRSWTTFKSKKDGLADKKIKNLFKDSRGWLYFISYDDGMSIWDGENMTIVDKSTGLSGNYIYDIFEDSKKQIWVGTDSGISMFDGNLWSSWNKKDGVGSKDVTSIVEDNFGNIWVTIGNGFSHKGISMWDGSLWHIFNKKNGLDQNDVNKLFVDNSGNLWISYELSFKNYISMYNGNWTHYSGKDGAFTASLIYQENNGDIIIFSGGKFSKFNGKSWVEIDKMKTKKTGYYDSNQNIWQITEDGVRYYNGTKWTKFSKKDELPKSEIRCIYEDISGCIWLGSQKNGIIRISM